MALTPAGWGLLPHAEQAIGAAHVGLGHAKSLDHDLNEDLAIGATRSVSTYVLPEMLARHMADRPGLRVAVRTSDSESLLTMVRHGELDIALTRDIPAPGLDAEPIYLDPLVFVAAPGAIPTTSGRIQSAELAAVPFIVFDRHSNYHELTQGLFSEAGVMPFRLLEVDNLETAKRMAERGLGLSLLPTTSVAQSLSLRSLVRIEVIGMKVEPHRIVAVRRNASASRAASELLELLRLTPDVVSGTRPLDRTV